MSGGEASRWPKSAGAKGNKRYRRQTFRYTNRRFLDDGQATPTRTTPITVRWPTANGEEVI